MRNKIRRLNGWIIGLMLLCIMTGCSHTQKNAADTQSKPSAVAYENGRKAFTQDGYYYIKDNTIEYMDRSGTSRVIYEYEGEKYPTCLCYHEGKLYVKSTKSEFVERFLELSLFYGLSSPLNSEMICIFPYF